MFAHAVDTLSRLLLPHDAQDNATSPCAVRPLTALHAERHPAARNCKVIAQDSAPEHSYLDDYSRLRDCLAIWQNEVDTLQHRANGRKAKGRRYNIACAVVQLYDYALFCFDVAIYGNNCNDDTLAYCIRNALQYRTMNAKLIAFYDEARDIVARMAIDYN